MSNTDAATPELLRLSQIVGNQEKGIPPIVPVCKATIWNWVKQGKFPQPIKLGGRVTVWRLTDIIEFLEGFNSLSNTTV